MTLSIQPPPIRERVLSKLGDISPVWVKWFISLFKAQVDISDLEVRELLKAEGVDKNKQIEQNEIKELLAVEAIDNSKLMEELILKNTLSEQDNKNYDEKVSSNELLTLLDKSDKQASEDTELIALLHKESDTNIFDEIILNKASGKGVKVDSTVPSFPWRDMLGEVKILSPGANDPTLAVFRGNIRQFSFSNAVMNEVFLAFHFPHDYVLGSNVFIHTYWGQIIVDSGGPAGVPGDCKWSFEATYAKGHNQAAFPATVTTSITQTASGTQYQHMLGEVQLSDASPSGSQIDSDNLEPDGVLLVRCYRDPADVADTLNQVPFLHYVDIHYQSSNIGTKQKAPDFYT